MATVVAAPDLRLVADRAFAPARSVRRGEWIVFAFLVYAPALTFWVPAPQGLRERLALANLAVALAYVALVYFDFMKPRLALAVARDWMPLGTILLAYREMGWFAMAHQGHALESRWVAWDRLVLHGGGQQAIEFLGPVLPSALEIAYSFVYALPPFTLAALYFHGRRKMADRFLTVVLMSVLLCYAQFPFWPSEPPRVVFPTVDLPFYDTVFRRFNLWMLGSYGIHTSVFPSAHVAGALSTAFGARLAMPERKWVYRALFVIAAAIAAATVYGRYHYLADAAYGAAIAALVNLLNRASLNLPSGDAGTSGIRRRRRAHFGT
jgi:membrane-associated phospholipid phosphatase